MNQYYRMGSLHDPGPIGVVLAVGVVGGLGYHIYRTKKGQVNREVSNSPAPWNPPPQQPRPQTNKSEMD